VGFLPLLNHKFNTSDKNFTHGAVRRLGEECLNAVNPATGPRTSFIKNEKSDARSGAADRLAPISERPQRSLPLRRRRRERSILPIQFYI
jgi:hypothetical protein